MCSFVQYLSSVCFSLCRGESDRQAPRRMKRSELCETGPPPRAPGIYLLPLLEERFWRRFDACFKCNRRSHRHREWIEDGQLPPTLMGYYEGLHKLFLYYQYILHLVVCWKCERMLTYCVSIYRYYHGKLLGRWRCCCCCFAKCEWLNDSSCLMRFWISRGR